MRYRPTAASIARAAGADKESRMLEALEPRVMLNAGLLADPISPDHQLWTVPRGEAIIDGVLDEGAWDGAFEVFRTQATRSDRAVWVRMMYNDAGLFLSVDVEDANIWADGVPGNPALNNRWDVEQDDSVTFYFDPDDSRDQYFQSDDRAIGVNLAAPTDPVEGPGVVRRWKYIKGDGLGNAVDVNPGGAMPDGLLYASTIRGTVNNPADVDQGWTIEMFIPWAALNMPAPVHGVTMGMNFDVIMDNDGGARNLIDNRSHPDPDIRYLQPMFVDDHVQGAHSSYTATQAGIRGPINYAEVMFIDARAGARPAPVTNLSVSGVGAYGARLEFTAPTGTTTGFGHVSRYEIRYSHSPIATEADWLSATLFRQNYTPRLAGYAETLRIAELAPGTTYHVAVRAIDAAGNYSDLSANATLTTTALPYAGYRGRLIPAPMGNTLMFENGEAFVAVGDHLGISWGYSRQLFPGDVWDNLYGVYQNFADHTPAEGHYSDYFDMLQAHGVNTMRVYLELQNVYFVGNPNPPRGLHWLQNNPDVFNDDMRAYMHNILREAGSRGIHIIFSPFDSFSYDEAFGLEGPWATNFGGPLTDINNFFQDPGTLEVAKARMAKVIQWANESEYADYVIGWEPLSEWESFEWTLHPEGDGEPGRETEMRRRSIWINELGAYTKQLDPDRIVFNSTIVRDPRGPVARQVFASRAFDALTPHLYTNSNDNPEANPHQDKSVLPAIENGNLTSYWLTHRHDSRPIINGEWGMTRAHWSTGRPQYSDLFTQQMDEAVYRTVTWSGFAAGQFGTGLRINTEELDWNHYLLTPAMRDTQLVFSTFLTGGSLDIDFAHFSGRSLAGRIAASAAGRALHAWGVSDGLQGVAYVLQDGNVSTGAVSGATLTISGLARNRLFDVEFWSTSAGTTGPISTIQAVWTPTGELVVTLPTFTEDLALKFVARDLEIQSQTLAMIDAGGLLITFGLGVDGQPYASILDVATGVTTFQDVASIADFHSRAVDITAFRSADGTIHLAAVDDRSHLWHFWGNPLAGTWSVVDHTAAINGPGFSGDLTSYQPSWGSVHIAGLDARGHAINYWWAPGLTSWQYTDLTVLADGPVLSGGLTGYVSGWDGLHLAGVNGAGEVIVYWWAPGIEAIAGRDTWLAQNMTSDFNGPTFVGQLDAYVTPWGGLNVAGRTASGEIYTYWWSPQLKEENLAAGRPDRWEVANITAAAGGPLVSQGTEVAVSTDGGLNIFGLDQDRNVHMFRWLPGGNWEATAVSLVTLAPPVAFPLASGSAGDRMVLAAKNDEDGAGTVVLFSFFLSAEQWQLGLTPLVAA